MYSTQWPMLTSPLVPLLTCFQHPIIANIAADAIGLMYIATNVCDLHSQQHQQAPPSWVCWHSPTTISRGCCCCTACCCRRRPPELHSCLYLLYGVLLLALREARYSACACQRLNSQCRASWPQTLTSFLKLWLLT